jgi:hypothetical protein
LFLFLFFFLSFSHLSMIYKKNKTTSLLSVKIGTDSSNYGKKDLWTYILMVILTLYYYYYTVNHHTSLSSSFICDSNKNAFIKRNRQRSLYWALYCFVKNKLGRNNVVISFCYVLWKKVRNISISNWIIYFLSIFILIPLYSDIHLQRPFFWWRQQKVVIFLSWKPIKAAWIGASSIHGGNYKSPKFTGTKLYTFILIITRSHSFFFKKKKKKSACYW